MTVINGNAADLYKKENTQYIRELERRSMNRLSRGPGGMSWPGPNELQESFNKHRKYSSSTTIIANLALQDWRKQGMLRDAQLGGNWGFTDNRIDKINSLDVVNIDPDSVMVVQANQQPAGGLQLLE